MVQELAEHCPEEGHSACALVPHSRLAALQAAVRALLHMDQVRNSHSCPSSHARNSFGIGEWGEAADVRAAGE